MAKKVLYIEDSLTDTGIVKEAFEKEGIVIDTAVTGEEGLKKARQIKPDLILLDLILPDIDGFEVCSQIKQDVSLNKSLVIVLSIKDNIEDITRAFAMGADDYIIKLPLPDLLTRKIKLYLGIR